MNLVDTTTSATGTDKEITRIYHHGADIVRVQVRRNFYKDQSYAAATVLNAQRNWTVLCATPASEWHDSPEGATLDAVADNLAVRAETILG